MSITGNLLTGKLTHGRSLIFGVLAEFSRICTQTSDPHQAHNPGSAQANTPTPK